MDSTQFATLLSALGAVGLGIAGAIRWAVTRITKSMDDQTRSNIRLADAQLDLAAAFAAQRADLEHITGWIYRHTPGAVPIDVERERTPVQSVPPLTPTAMRAFGGDYDDQPGERPGRERRQQAGPPRRTPVRGVPQQPRREQVTPNYRRPESNHDHDDER